MFYVYILINNQGRYYIGQTNNLTDRIRRHNIGQVSSTKPHRPWQLIYSQKFTSRSEAISRESYLKSIKNKKYLQKIINGPVV